MNTAKKNARGEHLSSMSMRPRAHQYIETCEGKTDQSFKKDCDLRVILDKFTRGSLRPDEVYRAGQYGDFTEATDFIQSQHIIAEMTQHFESLPSDLRDKFDNDVATYLDYVHDPKNAEEMSELGMNTDHFGKEARPTPNYVQNEPTEAPTPSDGDSHTQTDIED